MSKIRKALERAKQEKEKNFSEDTRFSASSIKNFLKGEIKSEHGHSGVKKKRYAKRGALYLALPIILFFGIYVYFYSQQHQDPFSTLVDDSKETIAKEEVLVEEKVAEVEEPAPAVVEPVKKEPVKREVVAQQPPAASKSREIVIQKVNVDISDSNPTSENSGSDEKVIVDFNAARRLNTLGGNFRSWNPGNTKPPYVCQDVFDDQNARLGVGKCLKLLYNVDHPSEKIENGFKMDMAGFEIGDFTHLKLYVKGDYAKGYPETLEVELRGEQSGQVYTLSHVKDSWEEVQLPLEKLKEKNTVLKEFSYSFRSDLLQTKKGIVYIDDIALEHK